MQKVRERGEEKGERRKEKGRRNKKSVGIYKDSERKMKV